MLDMLSPSLYLTDYSVYSSICTRLSDNILLAPLDITSCLIFIWAYIAHWRWYESRAYPKRLLARAAFKHCLILT